VKAKTTDSKSCVEGDDIMHPEEEAVPNLEISEKVGSTGYVGCLELPGGATVK